MADVSSVQPVQVSAKQELIGHLKRLGEFESEVDERVKADVMSVLGARPSLEMLDEIVKFYKREYDTIINDDIPTTLAEYGLKKVVIDGGEFDGAIIQPELFYETKTIDKSAMIAWLEHIGASDIVKDAVMLGKGGFTPELEAFLKERGYAYSMDEKVEGQTLKKTIRDWLESGGEAPPSEAVQVSVYNRAKITYPKRAI